MGPSAGSSPAGSGTPSLQSRAPTKAAKPPLPAPPSPQPPPPNQRRGDRNFLRAEPPLPQRRRAAPRRCLQRSARREMKYSCRSRRLLLPPCPARRGLAFWGGAYEHAAHRHPIRRRACPPSSAGRAKGCGWASLVTPGRSSCAFLSVFWWLNFPEVCTLPTARVRPWPA